MNNQLETTKKLSNKIRWFFNILLGVPYTITIFILIGSILIDSPLIFGFSERFLYFSALVIA